MKQPGHPQHAAARARWRSAVRQRFGRGGAGGGLGGSTGLAMPLERKSVVMDRLRWDLQSPDGLHGQDQYDGDDTLYLIVRQPATGRHVGSIRLLPSTGPHVLRDRLPHLCAGAVPQGADIWEITRLLTAPGLPPSETVQVRQQLAIALFEHGIEAGIARYTFVTQMAKLPALLSVGWDAEPLGMPHGTGDAAVAAMQIMVDAATLAQLRAAWGLPDPVLDAGPAAPPPPIPSVPEIDRERVRAL